MVARERLVLIGGVALGVLAIFGYNQYFAAPRTARARARPRLYVQVKQADGRTTRRHDGGGGAVRSRCARSFPTTSRRIRRPLLVASAEVVTAPDTAAEHLRFTMEQSERPRARP